MRIFFSNAISSHKNKVCSRIKSLSGKHLIIAPQALIQGLDKDFFENSSVDVRSCEWMVFGDVSPIFSITMRVQHLLEQLLKENRQDIADYLSKLDSPKKVLACAKDLAFDVVRKLYLGGDAVVRTAASSYQRLFEIVCNEQFSADTKNFSLSTYDQVHIFGFSSLNTQLFQKLFHEEQVYFYFLSPCMMYWGDVGNEKTSICEDKVEYHPLLASCGKIARNLHSIIHEICPHVEEEYILSKKLVQHPYYHTVLRHDVLDVHERDIGLLHMLQGDLLCLSNKREEKIRCSEDETVRVISAPSRLMEVECLYEFLLLWKRKAVISSDILIHVSNMGAYQPYIDRVFGRTTSELSYQLYTPYKNSAVTLFLRSLLFLEGRCTKQDMYDLLIHPVFLFHQHLQPEQIGTLVSYFDKSSFSEGVNADTLMHALQQEGIDVSCHVDQMNTWSHFEKKIIHEYVQGIENIDSATYELVCQWTSVMSQLFFMLQQAKSTKKTRDQWHAFFQEYKREFFSFEDAYFEQALELFLKEGCDAILLDLFSAVWYLQSLYDSQCDHYTYTFHAPVIFAEIGVLQGKEAPIVGFLGLQELDIPPINDRTVDSWMHTCLFHDHSWQEYRAFQRLQFLEGIHLAEAALFISYKREEQHKGQFAPPPRTVVHFLELVETGFSCTPSPFVQETARRRAHPVRDRLPVKHCVTSSRDMPKRCVEIAFLRSTAKHPIRTYLRKKCGVYLFEEMQKNDVWLGAKETWAIKKQLVIADHNKFNDILTSEIDVHTPYLQKAITTPFLYEKQRVDRFLRDINPQGRSFTIEFLPNCEQKTWIDEKKVLFPATSVKTATGDVFVVGSIEDAFSDGLVITDALNTASIYRHFPEIILYTLHHGGSCSLYSIKDEKQKKVTVDNPQQAIERFVTHALSCIDRPCCFMPEWIDDILKQETSARLEKKITHLQQEDRDVHLFFEKQGRQLLWDCWAEWQRDLTYLFEGIDGL